MTKEQVKDWLNGATLAKLADFNDNANKQFCPINGGGETDGSEVASAYNGLSGSDQDWINNNSTNIKDPC